MTYSTKNSVKFSTLCAAKNHMITRSKDAVQNLTNGVSGGMVTISDVVQIVVNIDDNQQPLPGKKNIRVFPNASAAQDWIEDVLISAIASGELNAALRKHVTKRKIPSTPIAIRLAA
jgi:hypothetical protein